MNETQIKTLDQVRRFLDGTSGIDVELSNKAERYTWIETTLEQFKYCRLGRPDRGIMLRYLAKASGFPGSREPALRGDT